MAFSRGTVHSDTARKEQIITEFFAQALHIILESRAPYVSSRNYSGEQAVSSPSSSCSSHRPRDNWFNLALRECPAARENIDIWRQSNLYPMIVDVILVQRAVSPEPEKLSAKRDVVRNQGLKAQHPKYMNLEKEDFGSETKSEKVIERWVVQYETRKGGDNRTASKRSGRKQPILLLRSLYTTLRLLPAYKLFRELSSGQIRDYTLKHCVNSFVEPFTREEEADMQRFNFSPVDTSSGRLGISVLYHNSVSQLNTEPSTPVSPQFITDYVGSPLVDPRKRFPSLPVSQSLPSSSPVSRQLSWNYDAHCAPPPSNFPSPSPTYSELQASISKLSSCLPPMSLPHLQEKFSFGGDESGRFYGTRISSSSSPRVSISRSSSRLSIQDDFDDTEFACHFVVDDDDDDMMDPGSRPGSFNPSKQPSDPFEPGGSAPMKKSQNAAVGALVQMLNKAPSLNRDYSNSVTTASSIKPEGTHGQRSKEAATHSSIVSSKTAADALAELTSYSEMKQQFLLQGGGAGVSQNLNKDGATPK